MNRAELVKTLELISPALSNTTLVPVWTCFMFRPNAIEACNDVIGITARCKATDKVFAISGVVLAMLQNSGAEETTFEVTPENVIVKTGKSVFKTPYFKEDEFLFEKPKETWTAQLPVNAELIKGLEICLTTASTDQSKPAFMGVCINFNQSKPTLFSTDSDAITKYTLSSKTKYKGVYTVPNSFCEALLKISAETETTDGVLSINDDWVKATLNTGYTVYGRIIINENPVDHQQVLTDRLGTTQYFVEVPKGLEAALARARVLADPESAKTRVSVGDDRLKLVTETHMGVVRDELKLKGHVDVDAIVHASLVARSLTYCDELAILEGVTAYRQGTTVLQIVANIGE